MQIFLGGLLTLTNSPETAGTQSLSFSALGCRYVLYVVMYNLGPAVATGSALYVMMMLAKGEVTQLDQGQGKLWGTSQS